MKDAADNPTAQTEFDPEKWEEYSENFMSQLIGVPKEQLDQHLEKTILEPIGTSLQEPGDHDHPKMLLEYFQSLKIAEGDRAGRLFQAALNMNLAEIQSLQVKGVEHLIATGCALGFALAQQDKTLASFILDNTDLKSNTQLLSVIVNLQYDSQEESSEFYDALFNLGLDLTYTPKGAWDNCIFFEMIGNPRLSEEYLISRLPQVHNVNVQNTRVFDNAAGKKCIELDDSLLTRAIATCRFELAKELVEMGADVYYSGTYPGHQNNVLQRALQSKNSEFIDWLLDKVDTGELPSDTLAQLFYNLEENQILKILSKVDPSNLDLSAPFPTVGSSIFSSLLSNQKFSEGFLIALLPYVKDVNVQHNVIMQLQNSNTGALSYASSEQLADSFLMSALKNKRLELATKLIEMGADVNYSYILFGNTYSVVSTALDSHEFPLIQLILESQELVLTQDMLHKTVYSSEAEQIWQLLAGSKTASFDLSEAPPEGSCVFLHLIKSSAMSEDLLISLLPYVKNVNVENKQKTYDEEDDAGNSIVGSYKIVPSSSLFLQAAFLTRFNLATELVKMGADVNYSYVVRGQTLSIWKASHFLTNYQEFMEACLDTGKLIVPADWAAQQWPSEGVTLPPLEQFAKCGEAKELFVKRAGTCTAWLNSNELFHNWPSLKKQIKYFSNPANAGTDNPKYVECFNDIKSLMLTKIGDYFSPLWNKCMRVCKAFSPVLGDGQHIDIPSDIVAIIGSFVFSNLLTELEEEPKVIDVTGDNTDTPPFP